MDHWDVRQLEYFAAVADELHFGRAAAREHISQSALSQQVRALERRLGVELLVRTTRSVRLTPVGRAVHEQAKALLAQHARAAERIDHLVSGRAGRLRIGFVPSAAFGTLPRIVAPFRRANPQVKLRLQEMPTLEQLRTVAQGDLDVGLVRDTSQATSVRLFPLLTEPLLLALPREHPAARRRRVRLAALAGEQFIVLPSAVAPAMSDVIAKLAAAAGIDLSYPLEALAFTTTLGLVGSGMGVAIVPASVRTNHPPGLVYRHIADEGAVSRLFVAVSEEHTDPLAAKFLRAAQTCFATAPDGDSPQKLLSAGSDAGLLPDP
ncbi:LysR family transcriptional regulator [Amycolatopsis rubida]|uniref:LysR family transcriptional regulator n=1 Tax=Amycolatopsis rubida TaxID=112413 RepID=A0ABX0CBQ4_9PSEU|nr:MULTISPECIES: LysR substrate-binding domain-containing protein [Amycolatopsis]MYW97365.1 LysR family transcriptional regulator [Amycolatopsis rubida]NEC62350.1 LysR family transcriptional regulator [Amycolatopsis rubida]OAP22807.1 Hca operon transcriptional activator [Amycolatopsis sp. M39]